MRRGAAAPLAAGLLALVARTAAAQDPAPAEPVVLERGTATFEVASERVGLVVWTSPTGPLFALGPIVARLGGELVVGPLAASHRLDVGGSFFLFGPGSATLTAGEEIERLSQAPIAAREGLLVPLDLLSRVYALTGYELTWDPTTRRLAASRRSLRRLPLAVDIDHFQGVTTVVLEFEARPDYRLLRSGGELRMQVLGDELEAVEQPATAPLVAALEVRRQEVVLRLEPGAAAEDYTLEDPFRLVFEVFARRAEPAAGAPLAPFLPPPRPGAGPEVIVIDPGHGGGDTGAIGPAGAREKDLTLTLSERLAAALRARLPIRVVLTRDEDAELPLATRAAIGNELEADLFLSLHLNSSYGRSARGTETYFLSLEASDERAAEAAAAANAANGAAADPAVDLQLILWDMAQARHLAASQQLANLIQEELNQALGLRDRGVKQAPFTVLMGAAMPAVLVELGFLSNPEEEERLRDPAYQTALTDALVRAISRFRAVTGEPPPEAAAGVERR
ncbi:MAG: N-acetylmuramoyl-L-alanine amidase family protein [Thermoanaerobaculia bacterium]